MANDWTSLTLEEAPIDIIDGDRGSNYPQQSDFVDFGHCLFLNAGNVTSTGFEFTNRAFITEEKDSQLRKGKLSRNDVVLTTRGTVGNCAYYSEEIPFAHVRINSGMVLLRSRSASLLPRYLYLFVRSKLFQDQVAAFQTGSAQPQLPIRDMKRIVISLPSPDTQEGIMEVLGSLDNKIEQNRRTGSKLESLARGVFKAWFVDFEPVKAKAAGATAFPGMPPETFATLPTQFTNSTLGLVPEGWTNADLGSEFELQVGYAFKSAQFTDNPDAIRLVRGDNVKEGWIEWGSKTRRWEDLNDKISGYNVAAGDVVIGMDGSKLGKNWARVREFDLPALLVQRVARFRANRLAGPSLLWLLISHPSFREFIDAVKTGTSIPHISGGQLRSFKFVKPGTDSGHVWSTFEDTVGPLLKLSDHFAGESAKLAALRDYLLPRLLSGRVRVDKSASR